MKRLACLQMESPFTILFLVRPRYSFFNLHRYGELFSMTSRISTLGTPGSPSAL